MSQLFPEELQALLQGGRRYTIPDLDTLRGVLNDAFTLYDVEAGKARLSYLLEVIEKRADPEVFFLIILDLARFLRPRLQKAVAEILDLQQHHVATLTDSFAPSIERRLAAVQAVRQRIRYLWAEAGITDTAALPVVEAGICRQIRSDAIAIARVEAGDLSDVDRLFREHTSTPEGLVQ
jgi:hypothetical protein